MENYDIWVLVLYVVMVSREKLLFLFLKQRGEKTYLPRGDLDWLLEHWITTISLYPLHLGKFHLLPLSLASSQSWFLSPSLPNPLLYLFFSFVKERESDSCFSSLVQTTTINDFSISFFILESRKFCSSLNPMILVPTYRLIFYICIQ